MALSKLPKLKLYCRQGKTFRHPFYFSDEHGNITNLSGYTARMEIRTEYPTTLSEAGDADVLVRLDTDNGGIVIDGPKGQLHIVIEAAVTATFPEASSYVYEPELITPSGEVEDFIAPSSFVVLPEVTL